MGFNSALLTPALSTHSSSSSVPTLSMVMNSDHSRHEGGMVTLDPMYPTPNTAAVSPEATNPHLSPSGSPGFQNAIIPTSAAASMAMGMPMTSGISHATPVALSTMQPTVSGINLAMIQNDGKGYMMSTDQHRAIVTSSDLGTSHLTTTQAGADLGYGLMPVDPTPMQQ